MGKAALPQRFEDSLGYLLHHLMYAFRQGLARRYTEQGYKVTHEEIMLLLLLRQEDGLTQTHIAEVLAKDKAVITRLLNGLVKKGYVERLAGQSDRRLVCAFLTVEGTKLSQQLFPMVLDFVSDALNGVEQDEFDAACAVLRRIIANLESINRSHRARNIG